MIGIEDSIERQMSLRWGLILWIKKTVEKHFPMIGKAYTAFLNKTRTKTSNESRKSAVTTL